MSTTAQTLINGAFNLIGVLTQGESPTSTESTDALAVLNAMMDAWSIERLMVPVIKRQVFDLTASQQDYTIGSGANWSVARPARIERAGLIMNTNPSQPVEIPMRVLSLGDWAEVRIKALTQTFPKWLFYDPTYPYGTVRVWPIPTDSTYDVALYFWSPVIQFADLSTTSYDLPPGYDLAIRYALAVELLPSFGVVGDSSTLVISRAAELKGNIKMLNAPDVRLAADPALQGDTRGVFDWRTGDTV